MRIPGIELDYENGHVVVRRNGIVWFTADTMSEALRDLELEQKSL